MQTIDMDATLKLFEACDGPMLDAVKKLKVCWCHTGSDCFALCDCFAALAQGPGWKQLIEGLKACSHEFYIRCPGFDRLAQVCDFEPAFDAASIKEKVQLDRIAQLEARVQELELRRKG